MNVKLVIMDMNVQNVSKVENQSQLVVVLKDNIFLDKIVFIVKNHVKRVSTML